MTVWVWRHPKPHGVAGLCIGCIDVPVDRRKAKRLAHRIRQHARREGGPRVVLTSPLQRSASVGRWLKRWGWAHHVDARLSEMDFGAWQGRRWDDIGPAALDEWCAQFAQPRACGGESVAQLLARCAAWLARPGQPAPLCVVGHAGWISAGRWLAQHPDQIPSAADWPPAVGHGVLVRLAGAASYAPSRAAAKSRS